MKVKELVVSRMHQRTYTQDWRAHIVGITHAVDAPRGDEPPAAAAGAMAAMMMMMIYYSFLQRKNHENKRPP